MAGEVDVLAHGRGAHRRRRVIVGWLPQSASPSVQFTGDVGFGADMLAVARPRNLRPEHVGSGGQLRSRLPEDHQKVCVGGGQGQIP